MYIQSTNLKTEFIVRQLVSSVHNFVSEKLRCRAGSKLLKNRHRALMFKKVSVKFY